jgi:hypothetical protein
MLDNIRGGILFGVPSEGMATSHLHAVVLGQANEQLINDLSISSSYLRSLDDRFSGIALLKDIKLHWAYETCTSPTVEVRNASGFTVA